ncbi:MAG: membrane lipoprotein lipid attachment site-containing protein [Alistipes sp.]|nr:membrane lipoprotein lipid attachment site-containing protein [Alistipes sp.]
MKKILLFAVAVAFITSCSSTEYITTSTTYDYRESSARLLEGSSNFIVTPTIADLEVSSKKITHIEKDAFANFTVSRSVINNIAAYKRIALGKASKAYDADILLGAEIDVETIDQHLVITVTGYPAVYKKFRNATEKDLELVRDVQEIRNSGSVIVDAPQQIMDVKIVK